MKRNKIYAWTLLDLVQEHGVCAGMDLLHLKTAYRGRNGEFSNVDQFHLDLLVNGGFLFLIAGAGAEPTKIQITWAGYDLLESLHKELNE